MNKKTLMWLPHFFAVTIVCAAAVPSTAATATETPIIAELVASPEAFTGKTVVIYGLVVSVSEGGTVFMLQDVSQNPLRVVGAGGASVEIGDQVLVRGVFRVDGGQHYVSAERIEPVKVTGG